MNSLQFSTDKVLLTVFVTVLVGFLTAAMSIVRLVNDKESKTTDYRQSWTDSLRKCFASLISNINTLASLTTSRMKSANGIDEILRQEIEGKDDKQQSVSETTRDYLVKRLLEEDSHIRDLRMGMHESYALTRLHFKPNDLSFSRVEQKFDVVLDLFTKLNSLSDQASEGERMAHREKIHASASEITAFSRDILKTEWEAVKRGELAYQRTKFWSIVGGAVALISLALFGLATLWTLLRVEAPTPTHSGASASAQHGQEIQKSLSGKVDLTAPTVQSPSQTTQTVNVYSPSPCPLPQRQPVQTKSATSTCQLK